MFGLIVLKTCMDFWEQKPNNNTIFGDSSAPQFLLLSLLTNGGYLFKVTYGLLWYRARIDAFSLSRTCWCNFMYIRNYWYDLMLRMTFSWPVGNVVQRNVMFDVLRK